MPHVYIALGGAHCIRADHHAFEQAVGVALHDGAVHERARVALVAIRDNDFHAAGRPAHGVPFHAGGKPRAAPAPEARGLQLFNDRLGRHGKEHLLQGQVTVMRDIVRYAVRVHLLVVPEHDPVLLLIKRHVVNGDRGFVENRIFIEELAHREPGIERSPHDSRHMRGLHFLIEISLGLHAHQRPLLAEALTSRSHDLHVRAGLCHIRLKGFQYLERARGPACGAAAQLHLLLAGILPFCKGTAQCADIFSVSQSSAVHIHRP